MSDEMTPAAIVQSVRIPAALARGEAELTEMKTRSAELHAQIRDLNAERSRGGNSADIDRAVTRLSAEHRVVAEKMGPVRRNVVALRIERAAAVRQAMAPTIAAAARDAYGTLADLRVYLDRLATIEAELARLGDAGLAVGAPDLAGLSDRLARLAGPQ